MNIFGDMKILRIYLGVHHKIGLYLGLTSMHFWVFSLCQGLFAVAKISNIFEILEIPDIFGG